MKLSLNASCSPSRYHKCALLGIVSTALLVSGCGGDSGDQPSATVPHPVPKTSADAMANVDANPNLSPERKAEIKAGLKAQEAMAARVKLNPPKSQQPQQPGQPPR
jgi:hypothetical protein